MPQIIKGNSNERHLTVDPDNTPHVFSDSSADPHFLRGILGNGSRKYGSLYSFRGAGADSTYRHDLTPDNHWDDSTSYKCEWLCFFCEIFKCGADRP